MAKRAKKERQKTVSVFFDFMLGTLGIILGIGLGIALFIVGLFLGLYSIRHKIKAIAEEFQKL
jgi:predicted lipid-binding transport protein (Tim44 family)